MFKVVIVGTPSQTSYKMAAGVGRVQSAVSRQPVNISISSLPHRPGKLRLAYATVATFLFVTIKLRWYISA